MVIRTQTLKATNRIEIERRIAGATTMVPNGGVKVTSAADMLQKERSNKGM